MKLIASKEPKSKELMKSIESKPNWSNPKRGMWIVKLERHSENIFLTILTLLSRLTSEVNEVCLNQTESKSSYQNPEKECGL